MDVSVEGGLKDTRSLYRTDSIKTVSSTSSGPGGNIVIADPNTLVKVGDTFRAENGPLAGQEFPVIATTQNSFTIASKQAPANGNAYYTLRPVTSRVNADGTQSVTTSQGPTQFTKNGVDVTVNQDTATPSNSRGFPVIQLNTAGSQFDGATAARQDTGNTSLASIDTKLPAQVSGRTPVTAEVTSSALPTGAATEATLAAMSAKIPNLGQQTSAQSQSVVLASDMQPIQSVSATKALTVSSVSANAQTFIASTEVLGFSAIMVQVTGTFVGTLTPSFSNDNTIFVGANLQTVSSQATAPVQAITTAGIYLIPVIGRYFRILSTAWTSGTATGTAWTLAQPIQDLGQRSVTVANTTLAVTQSGTWTVQPGNTANTTPWLTSSRAQDGAGNQITSEVAGTQRGLHTFSVGGAVVGTGILTYPSGVNASTYTTVITATTGIASQMLIFESGGFPLQIATGAAGSEVAVMFIPPGGLSGPTPLYFPSGTRISVRAATSDVPTAGNIIMTLIG
jgi:hypothetical protein